MRRNESDVLAEGGPDIAFYGWGRGAQVEGDLHTNRPQRKLSMCKRIVESTRSPVKAFLAQCYLSFFLGRWPVPDSAWPPRLDRHTASE